MTYLPLGAGWCVSGTRQPHWTDLLIRSNAAHPMCQACHNAWLRDDTKGTP